MKITKFISLSHPLDNMSPVYGSMPKTRITPIKSIKEGGTCNIYTIFTCNHAGTHVDAPAHFISNGRAISEYSIDELIFYKPLTLDIPKAPGEWVEKEDVEIKKIQSNVDCILIKTGFGKFRNSVIYSTQNPGIDPDAILTIRRNLKTVRCMGIDTISISGYCDRTRGRKSHISAFRKDKNLGPPLLVIEDMNLSLLDERTVVKKIIVVPWFVKEVDSAPCTVLAEVMDHG